MKRPIGSKREPYIPPRLASICFLLAALLWSPLVWGGSYLDRAQFLVSQTHHAGEYLRSHLRNRQLAELVRYEAEGRLRGAKVTLVPKQVVMAHPHLLLMLENFERAAAAAVAGDQKLFYRTQEQAKDEALLFQSILLQLGWQLPSKKRRRGGP